MTSLSEHGSVNTEEHALLFEGKRVNMIRIISTIFYSEQYIGLPMLIVDVDAPEYVHVRYELMNESHHEIKTTSGRLHRVYFECDPVAVYCLKISVGSDDEPDIRLISYDLSVLDSLVDFHDSLEPPRRRPIDHMAQANAKKEMANKRQIALHKIEELKKSKLKTALRVAERFPNKEK